MTAPVAPPGVVAPHPEGPDAWCYDGLVMRQWDAGNGVALGVLRSLELVWLYFDSNPAAFANFVLGEQALEDFLVDPPAGPTPPALRDLVRDHLRGLRRAGRSTWLALDAGPGVVAPSWTLDGVGPADGPLPGPAAAGVYGGASALTRRGLRALAAPGPVVVHVRAHTAGSHVALDAVRTVTLEAQQPRRVIATLAPAAAPDAPPTLVLDDEPLPPR